MDWPSLLATTAVAVLAYMVTFWAVSLVLRDASIVDIGWGLGFVVVAWVTFFVAGGEPRSLLLTVLASVWGLRLCGYLLWRSRGQGEDYRYAAMRRHWGPRFPLISLVTVFLLQGVVMWVVSLPIQLGQRPPGGLGALDAIGAGVWLVGLSFEVVGDWQLTRFRADPANEGAVMDRGLWRYTRHPNYFGDSVVWWGLFVIAASAPGGGFAVVGPVVMTFFLLRVSGVAHIERGLTRRRAGYEAYQARTSAFFPLPPRKGPLRT